MCSHAHSNRAGCHIQICFECPCRKRLYLILSSRTPPTQGKVLAGRPFSAKPPLPSPPIAHTIPCFSKGLTNFASHRCSLMSASNHYSKSFACRSHGRGVRRVRLHVKNGVHRGLHLGILILKDENSLAR